MHGGVCIYNNSLEGSSCFPIASKKSTFSIILGCLLRLIETGDFNREHFMALCVDQ